MAAKSPIHANFVDLIHDLENRVENISNSVENGNIDTSLSNSDNTPSPIREEMGQVVSSIIEDIQDDVPLKDYQSAALEWAYKREMEQRSPSLDSMIIGNEIISSKYDKNTDCPGGIIVLPQGSGKTLVTLKLIQRMLNQHEEHGCTLVVCPKSVISGWKEQIAQFFGNKIKAEYINSENKSMLANMNPSDYHVIVVNYRTISGEFAQCDFQTKKVSDLEVKIQKKREEITTLEFSKGDTYKMITCNISIKKRNGVPFENIEQFNKGLELSISKLDEEIKDLQGSIESIKTNTSNSLKQTFFYSYEWERVVLDECQKIKNGVKTTDAMCMLPRRYSWLLTGTLINNHVEEYYHYFRFIGLSIKQKCKEWGSMIKNNQVSKNILKEQVAQVMFCLKRSEFMESQKENMKELRLFSYRHPFMTTEEKDRYLSLLGDIRTTANELNNIGTNSKGVKEKEGIILSKITEMRKICCGVPTDGKDCSDPSLMNTTKMIMLKLYLLNCIEEKDKVIIFCSWVKVLNIAKNCIQHLSKDEDCPEFLKDVQSTMIIGNMNSSSREASIEKFRTDPKTRFMLISTEAGGTGLNLQVASKAVILSSDFKPTSEEQAIMRLYRIGQLSDVDVVYLLIIGTIEEIIYGYSRIKASKCREMQENQNFDEWTVSKEKLPSISARGFIEMMNKTVSKNSIKECKDSRVELMKERFHYYSWEEHNFKCEIAAKQFMDPERVRRGFSEAFPDDSSCAVNGYSKNSSAVLMQSDKSSFDFIDCDSDNYKPVSKKSKVNVYSAVRDNINQSHFSSCCRKCFKHFIWNPFFLDEPNRKYMVLLDSKGENPLLSNHDPGLSVSSITQEKLANFGPCMSKTKYTRWMINDTETFFIDLYSTDVQTLISKIYLQLSWIIIEYKKLEEKGTELSHDDQRIVNFVKSILGKNSSISKEDLGRLLDSVSDIVFGKESKCMGAYLHKLKVNNRKIKFFVPFTSILDYYNRDTPLDLKFVLLKQKS